MTTVGQITDKASRDEMSAINELLHEAHSRTYDLMLKREPFRTGTQAAFEWNMLGIAMGQINGAAETLVQMGDLTQSYSRGAEGPLIGREKEDEGA